MQPSNCPSGPLWHSFIQRVLKEREKLYHIYFFTAQIASCYFRVLLQPHPNFCVHSTSFVTLVLILIKQNFLPLVLLTAETSSSSSPLKADLFFSLTQQHSQFFTEGTLKTPGFHCISPTTQRLCKLNGWWCCHYYPSRDGHHSSWGELVAETSCWFIIQNFHEIQVSYKAQFILLWIWTKCSLRYFPQLLSLL